MRLLGQALDAQPCREDYSRMRLCNLAILLLFILGGCSGGNDSPKSSPTSDGLTPSREPSVTTRSETDLTNNRIVIPSIGVEVPLFEKPVPPKGSLPNPDGPDDAVIYDFVALDGFGGMPGNGNVVISAKLDSGSVACQGGNVPPPCSAAFWSLGSLRPGASIQVIWDGELNEYTVVSFCRILNTKPFDSFVKTTDYEAVTLITATGGFDEAKRQYTHTLVVRGAKQLQSPPLDCGEGTSEPLPTGIPKSQSSVSVMSVSSPVARGHEAVVVASADPGVGCSISMKKKDSYQVLGFVAFADDSGRITFSWRIGESIAPGEYILNVDCNATPVIVPFVVS